MHDAARAANVAARLHQWFLRRLWPPPLNRKRCLSGAPLFVAGACAATAGTIQVTTRGQCVLLRSTKHRTEIVSVSEPELGFDAGTQIIITFGPDLPEDGEYFESELSWAEATIRLAKVAGPVYARRPSPHWFDREQLSDCLFYIEPTDTTVREFIASLDGCSGAAAGRIAAAFGKNRSCQSMSEADAAKLLECAQADARVVGAEALGPIGKLAFGDQYDGYACKSGNFKHGAHRPQADVPFLVEAWAYVGNRDGRECTLSLMANRTALTTYVRGSRSWKGNEITVSGAELYS